MNEIVKLGHPSLKSRSNKVTEFDKGLHKLIDKMYEIMYNAHGVGLAAPQISKNIQVFVYDSGNGPKHCINPRLISKKDNSVFYEGCLSVPGYYFDITRADYVKVESVNIYNKKEIHEGDELIGRVLQHEMDHLKGKVLLSHLKRKERKEAITRIALEGFPGKHED